jgi:hypothetical protein
MHPKTPQWIVDSNSEEVQRALRNPPRRLGPHVPLGGRGGGIPRVVAGDGGENKINVGGAFLSNDDE